MKNKPYFMNFWRSLVPDTVRSPRLPFRIAFTTFFFLLFAWLVWIVSPKPNIPNDWFYGIGAVAFVGLIWSNERIYQHSQIYAMSDMAWYRRLWHQSALPFLTSAIFFYMVIFPILLSSEKQPDLHMEIAGKHWAFVYFPVMVLFSAMLLLLTKPATLEVIEEKFDEIIDMLGTIQEDMVELEDVRKQFSAEPFLREIRAALPFMWKEGMEQYLAIAPDAFSRPIHQLPNPYIFRVLPCYGYKAMLARVNALVKTGNITISSLPNFKDGTYVEMAYKSRKVRFRHPEATATINEMMGELSLLLLPDYHLRHCKLLSEPKHPYQWMTCLQPKQWQELEAAYGLKKMALYFDSVDRSYHAGLLPNQKIKDASLELFKMTIKSGNPPK